jgi:hypothetical protein
MKLWRVTSFGLVFVVVVLIWIFVIGISSNQPGSFFNKGHNAVWIGHKWVDTEMSDSTIQKLVNNFRQNQIDTVFVHVGPLEEDGTIDPEIYKYALDFIDTARIFDEDIEYQAWLGQIRSKIDLSNPEVRHNVANVSMIMSQMVGFDGIHFDVEPVWDGDSDFIRTLKEAKEVIPSDKKISVALAEYIPGSLIWFIEEIWPLENYNSEVNYENVADYADQIVVMVYDLGIEEDWKYHWIVQEETIRVTDLLPDKEVFIAIPAYEDEKEGFHPEVENVKNGLIGIIKGLNNFRSNEKSFAGVAIYPYWEIDDSEWEVYNDLWLK